MKKSPQEVQKAVSKAVDAICSKLDPDECNTILAGRAELLGWALLARFNGEGFVIDDGDLPPGGMKSCFA